MNLAFPPPLNCLNLHHQALISARLIQHVCMIASSAFNIRYLSPISKAKKIEAIYCLFLSLIFAYTFTINHNRNVNSY